ncbi:MAG TPA: helix-turn-helix transcriptional regulator [Pseudonocardiaceae bacterium]|jgi:transcriptional regulator with XRE-family HTH domain|nr:helix-turn-helix transcriptional regulator [Pseudonocardiaceae bacterium]
MATTNNFGIALRGWRERLSPRDAGLDPGDSRRVQGLRRAELAGLAGLSVDYVIRLEQGRARYPSAQVISALARALKLDTSERDHLFRCAHIVPPTSGILSHHVPMRVQRLVQRLDDAPVAVFAADWTIISWNAMWTAAIGDPGVYGWHEHNLVAGMFRSVNGRRPASIAAWPVRSRDGDEAEEEALVADLRVTAAAYPTDARLSSLVERTIRASRRFARLWSTGTAGMFVGDRKTIEHPVVGDIDVDLDVLLVPGVDLRIVTYATAAGTADARKLESLRVVSRS